MTWHRDVFETMGTVVSLRCDVPESATVNPQSVHAVFARFDNTYSLYKPDSELSRIASGALRLTDASQEVRDTYATALEWRASTRGSFTPHRPDDVIDLSGVVKAMAMDAAANLLGTAGAQNWCLNVGGDVLVSGLDEASEHWTIGIADPLDRTTLLTSAQLVGPRRACATSGSAERGDHIWSLVAGPAEFTQATVIANDIVTADVLATAIISGGSAALDYICATWDIDAMTVDPDGSIRATPNFLSAKESLT